MIDYQIKFWEHLAVDSISNDDAYIFITGLQSPVINLVILKKQNEANIKSVIDKASEFFTKHKAPWGVNIIEDEASQNIIIAVRYGLRRCSNRAVHGIINLDNVIELLDISNCYG